MSVNIRIFQIQFGCLECVFGLLRKIFPETVCMVSLELCTANMYNDIPYLLLHKRCTLSFTTSDCSILLLVVLNYSYSTTNLQQNVVISTTILLYFIWSHNCCNDYNNLLYTKPDYNQSTTFLLYTTNMYISATTEI